MKVSVLGIALGQEAKLKIPPPISLVTENLFWKCPSSLRVAVN